jgi:hypothetical protein
MAESKLWMDGRERGRDRDCEGGQYLYQAQKVGGLIFVAGRISIRVTVTSNRYDLSVRVSSFCPVDRMIYLRIFELGLPPSGPTPTEIWDWHLACFSPLQLTVSLLSWIQHFYFCWRVDQAIDEITHSLLNRRTPLGQFRY